MQHSGMHRSTTDMAQRIAEITRGDSTRTIAAKVVQHGGNASHTAVSKWLAGGNIDEANLVALAAAYLSSPAYIRYGVREAPQLTERQQAAAELVANDPPLGSSRASTSCAISSNDRR